MLLLHFLDFAGFDWVFSRLLEKLQGLGVDFRVVQVLLSHLFLHDGTLEVLVPSLLVLDLVFHELFHSSDLYLTILRLKFPLQWHLGHLIGLLHLVLILHFLCPLVLRLYLHGIVMQSPILALDWVDASTTVPIHFLLVLELNK